MKRKITAERMQNGLIRIFDYSCQWSVLYRQVGKILKFHCGPGSDLAIYRAEARKLLK
jgi:hypothetical protein